jgi:tetratricopeptide (TPR) repeat protein
LSAQGNLVGAIEKYKKAQSITPMVQYAGALYDLYVAAGKRPEAIEQKNMVDLVAKLEEANGQKANRTLSLILANQDRNLAKSLELAQADFEIRKDVYTSDAQAWALLKNKRFQEARTLSDAALKLGTPEAVFLYHAGMIANESGEFVAARKYLSRALEMNAAFDFHQAQIARKTLAALETNSK